MVLVCTLAYDNQDLVPLVVALFLRRLSGTACNACCMPGARSKKVLAGLHVLHPDRITYQCFPGFFLFEVNHG